MTDQKKPLTDEEIGFGGNAAPAPKALSDTEIGFEPTARGFKGWAQDAAATAVKGAISVPEAIVGLADIPTGGRVGKFLENKDGAFGFRPDEAKAIANDWHSDATKEAQRKFQEADGIWDKTKTAVQNPSLIATTVGESLPLMIAGGAIGRGLLAATKYGAMAANAGRLSASEAAALKAAQISAGAAGEGATMAGSAAEQIRQQTDDRLLSPTQAAAAAGTGVMGGVVSRLSGGLANELGIGEADTMFTQGARGVVNDVASAKSIPRQVIEGAVTEGLLEELPQSVGEQILQNLALNKNWAEGLDDAVVMGALSGGLMGSGAAGLHGFMAKGGAPALTPEQSPAQHRQPAPEQPLQLGNSPDPLIQFRDGTVARQSEIDAHLASLPESERQTFVAQIFGYAPQQADEPQLTTSPGATQFDGVATEQPSASVAAPDFDTSLGAQPEPQGGSLEFQRQIDTSGLSLERLDSPFAQSVPATALDRQALARQGAYPTSPTPAPVLDTRRLSEKLGLSSNRGGLEAAAAMAVDSGVSPISQTANTNAFKQGGINGTQTQEAQQAVAGQSQGAGAQERVAAAPKIRAVKLKDGTTAHVNEVDLTSGASQLRTFTADGKPRAVRLPASNIAPAAPKVVLQNRNRATPASIAQMNAIASKPDFLRTGASNTMDNGAPIVFGDLPQKVAIGRAQMVADGNGQRVPTQYAVVEAQDLITSNHADGSPVAEYANGVDGKLRAVAGNGRAAGLKAAWQRGTAGQYGQELVQDAPNLGIAPEVLAQFEAPVLVRVMDAADVTPDMGDRSNVQAGLQMSAVEQASNDAQRLNLRDMEFDELGNPTAQTVMRFMQGMPVQERGNMLDSQGRATSQLLDRIRAAAFKQAYMSDSLVELAAQSADPEAKNILNGLAIVAGDMAQLAGTGDFDIRQAVTDAANMAVTAGRTGQSIAQYLQTRQIDENPETVVVMQFMAQNVRSAKRIADGLRAWAELAQSQIAIARQNAEQDTMFGDTPTLSRRELFERLNNDNLTEIEQQQLIEQQRRAELTKQGTQRPSAERAGNADGASDGAESRGTEPTNAQDAGREQADFALEQQTPDQIRAQEEAQAQAARDKAKEDAQAAEAERKSVERQEVTQRSEAAANDFQLGQSAEDNLSGQGDIFSSAPAQPESKPKNAKEALERVRAKKAAEKNTAAVAKNAVAEPVLSANEQAIKNTQDALTIQNTRSRLTAAYNKQLYRDNKKVEDFQTLRSELEELANSSQGERSRLAQEVLEAIDGAIGNLEMRKRWEAEQAQPKTATTTQKPTNVKEGFERVRAKKAAEKPAKNDATRLGSGATGVADNALSGKDAGAPYQYFEEKTGLIRDVPSMSNRDGTLNDDGKRLAYTEWSAMSEDERALIHEAIAARKTRSQQADDSVRKEYLRAEKARLEGERIILSSNGNPYKTEGAAAKFIEEKGIEESHYAGKVDGGWAAVRRTPSEMLERENGKKGIEDYTTIQSRVVAEMGLTQAWGEDAITDAQWEKIDNRVDAIQRGQRGLPPVEQATAEAAKDSGKLEAPTQPDDPIMVDGLRVSPVTIKRDNTLKSMWEVQSAENAEREKRGERQIGGNSLHGTKEQAIAAAKSQAQDAKDNALAEAEQAQQEKIARDAAAAKKADTINGFTVGMAPNTAALATKALGKLMRFREKVASVREHIEAWHKAGELEVSTTQEPRIKPMSRMAYHRADQQQQDAHEKRMKEAGNKTVYWVNDIDLGKTAFDYASHLLNEDDQAGTGDGAANLRTKPKGATTSTIRHAASRSYGKLLERLEAKGLVHVAQTEEDALQAAAKARAAKTGQSVAQELNGLRQSVQNSIAVWHGTPHRGIEKTGFKLNKIGTGEGAQAYGWGIYFASQRVVAEGYRNSTTRPEVEIGGRRFKADGGGTYRDDAGIPLGSTNTLAHDDAARGLYGSKANQPIETLAEEAESYLQSRSWMTNERIAEAKKAILNGEVKLINEGQLYGLDLPIEKSDLLDWDKPLSEQPKKVLDALKSAGILYKPTMTGSAFYQNIQRNPTHYLDKVLSGLELTEAYIYPDRGASMFLNALGIPGLRYLDGNSRADGKGSHNYVIWDEALLTPEAAQIDAKFSKDGAIEGFFDRQTGKSFLVADNLTEASAPGTLMHEVGIHMAAGGKLEPLFKRAGSLLKTGTQNEFIQRVKARMARAGETSDEEAAAYIVTEYENDRAKAPITIGKWLADLTAAVRAWLFGNGVILKAEQLTVVDIAAVARANARSMARGGPNGGPTGGQAFSRNIGDAMPHPFTGFTREKFLGKPKITPDSNAKDLIPSGGKSIDDKPAVPFSNKWYPNLVARYSENGAAVYDGEKVIASYYFGDTIVVDKKYRRAGIGSELVYQWRMRNPNSKTAATRTKKSQALQEKVWDRVQRELYQQEYGQAFSRTALPATLNIDGKDRPTTNINGQPIHPTEEGVRNFYRWFGDSKVVDADGEPLVVYHGTDAEFNVFQPSSDGVYGPGAYLTKYSGDAATYGRNVMPVYASLQNPYVATPGEARRARKDGGAKAWSRAIQDKGHDGIVLQDMSVVVAFRPEQIKSAIGNNGNFDGANPDIRFGRSNIGQQGAQNGQENGMPRGLSATSTAQSRTLEDKINADLRRLGDAGDGLFRAASIPQNQLPDALSRALGALRAATGTQVHIFRNLTPQVLDFNGVSFRDGTVHINETSQNPATLTAAHEWLHNLRRTNHDLYRELADEVARQGRLPEYQQRLKRDGETRWKNMDVVEEELTAAAVSDALTDPVFLQRLAERDQSAFRRVAKAFLEFLKTLTAGWKDQGSNAYLQDVEAFRDKLEQVLDKLPVAKQKPGDIQALFLRVWHGTPHRGIEKTGFKLNKIGTGEGAQAYGWGIYFAGDKDVAEGYRKALSADKNLPTTAFEFNGERYSHISPRGHALNLILNNGKRQALSTAREMLADAKAGRPYAVQNGEAHYREMVDFITGFNPTARAKIKSIKESGQLYSADIPENHDLLDLDKPLGKQPAKVQRAIAQVKSNTPKEMRWMVDGINSESTGRDIYGGLSDLAAELNPDGVDNKQQAGSELLLQYGVPGLRYLDGNSRSAGDGRHNYVIWDEALLTPEKAQIEAMYSRGRSQGASVVDDAALQRQFDETASAYGGQDAYAKAKADGKTKLNYGQWVQVRTPAFKAWFGDWEGDPANASKVVDSETGEPLVVYHGTDQSFRSFAKEKLGEATGANSAGQGFFFVSRADVAESYAHYAALDAPIRRELLQADRLEDKGDFDGYEAAIVRAEQLEQEIGRQRSRGQNVIPTYLSIQNPAVMDAQEETFTTLQDEINTFIKKAKKDGRDGVIIKNLDDDPRFSDRVGDHYIAFNANQAKSSIGNNGNFDPENDDTTYFGQKSKAKQSGSKVGTPTDRAVMDMVRDGKTAQDVLRLIAGTSRSKFNKQVARLLLKTGAAPSVHIVGDLGSKGGFKHLAKYSRKNHALSMTEAATGRAEQIFLHEMIHAATLMALDRKSLPSAQMRVLFNHVKKQGGAAGQYGMTNVGEFVSEAFTNPKFQQALRGMKAPAQSPLHSAWDYLVRTIKSILGLPHDSTDALSAALEIGVAVMRENMALRKKGLRGSGADANAGVNTDVVSDIYGDQIEVNGQWYHAERVFGRPASSYKIGDYLDQLSNASYKKRDESPNEFVSSDLFRESGANISHTQEKISNYADAMRWYGGWGNFPPIVGRIETITRDDVRKYKEYQKKGYADELSYSRPLTESDIGKRYVHIENGHNRAYAAKAEGIDIPVYDLNVQESGDDFAHFGSDANAGIDQTQTPEFKRWFGDSKVVDADGKPLVVYHGSRFGGFSVFVRSAGGFIYTTPNANYSSRFSGASDGSAVYPVYVSIKKPLDLTHLGERSMSAEEARVELKRLGVNLDEVQPWEGAPAESVKLYGDGPIWRLIREDRFSIAAKNAGFDGIKINEGDGETAWVAFESNQIKSSTGNNGNFDPEDDDIAYFGAAEVRDIKTKAIDQLDRVFSHPGKVSLWDKTVGTMRHLAEREESFKPVFETAQGFIDDVSMLANDAADRAPRLLPRVEGLGDIFGRNRKKTISAQDSKAVAAPLFQGTLNWGRDLDGKPAQVSDLKEKYEGKSADDKAQMMLKTGQLDPEILKMWQGMQTEQYEKAIATRFENTFLKGGVVWKDAELVEHFKATPQQISLYREARAAIDRSIDMTARADMLRLLGEDYEHLRDVILDAPSLDQASVFLLDTLEEDAKADFDSRDRLADLMHGVRQRQEKANDLMKAGYAPLSRFGRYTVDVVDANGKREYFGMFESMKESNAMFADMKKAFPNAEVKQGTISQEEFKLFAGVTPESLELFGNMLGLEGDGNEARDKAFQKYLQLTKNNHSALKRLIHRQGIAGYSEDVGRVLASFVYSNARQAAGGLSAGKMERAISEIPKGKGELRDVAMGLRSYIQDPQEEGQAIRGMLFAQYLGGSVASAMVNMTQPFAVTMPYLSQFGGMAQSGAHLAKALKDMATKGFKYETDLANAMQHAEDDGIVSPQEIHQLMGQARGAGGLRVGDGTKLGDAKATAANNWEKLKVLWGQPFALAEQFNRRSTFIAAFRIAKEQGMANPAEFARKAVLDTQLLFSKANKPKWARGAIGGTLFTFKSYSVGYLELLQRTWNAGAPGSPERKAGRRAVAWSMAMLMMMGGAGGLPFMEDLEDLIDGIAQMMGLNFSTKQKRQEFLREYLGKEASEFIENGMSGIPGAPIDVSGRLGMGNLIPGTGLLLTKQNRERDLLEVLGPAGDLVKRGFTGAGKALTGDIAGAAMEVSPTAVRNVAKGWDMGWSGMYKDAKGYKVIDTTLDEAIAKAAGFQPRSVAEIQEANSFMMRSKSFYSQTSGEIKAQWADAIFRKDDAALERVRERLAAWNRDNPDQPIVVKIPDIMKRVREMGKDRTRRIADTAPKALRAQMRDMAREASM